MAGILRGDIYLKVLKGFRGENLDSDIIKIVIDRKYSKLARARLQDRYKPTCASRSKRKRDVG
jgi:hypothetical protein